MNTDSVMKVSLASSRPWNSHWTKQTLVLLILLSVTPIPACQTEERSRTKKAVEAYATLKDRVTAIGKAGWAAEVVYRGEEEAYAGLEALTTSTVEEETRAFEVLVTAIGETEARAYEALSTVLEDLEQAVNALPDHRQAEIKEAQAMEYEGIAAKLEKDRFSGLERAEAWRQKAREHRENGKPTYYLEEAKDDQEGARIRREMTREIQQLMQELREDIENQLDRNKDEAAEYEQTADMYEEYAAKNFFAGEATLYEYWTEQASEALKKAKELRENNTGIRLYQLISEFNRRRHIPNYYESMAVAREESATMSEESAVRAEYLARLGEMLQRPAQTQEFRKRAMERRENAREALKESRELREKEKELQETGPNDRDALFHILNDIIWSFENPQRSSKIWQREGDYVANIATFIRATKVGDGKKVAEVLVALKLEEEDTETARLKLIALELEESEKIAKALEEASETCYLAAQLWDKMTQAEQ